MPLFGRKENLINTFSVVSARADPDRPHIHRDQTKRLANELLAPVVSKKDNVLVDLHGIGGTGRTTFVTQEVRGWCADHEANYIGFGIELPNNAAEAAAATDGLIARLEQTRRSIEKSRRPTVVVVDDLDRLAGHGVDWNQSVGRVQQKGLKPLTQLSATAVVVTRSGTEKPAWVNYDLRSRRRPQTLPPFTAEEITAMVGSETGEIIFGLSHGHPATVVEMAKIPPEADPEELTAALLGVLGEQNQANLREMPFPWQQTALELVSPAMLFNEPELKTAIRLGHLGIPKDEDTGLHQVGWDARDAGVAAWDIPEDKYRLDPNLRARLETHLKETEPDIHQKIVSAFAGLSGL